MRLHLPATLAAALVLCASPLTAQKSGLWMGLGVGSGSQQLACDICRGNRMGGWSARAALGGTLNRKVRLGGEFRAWTDMSDDIRFTFFSVTPAVYWYPSPRRTSYFLMGGLGYAAYRASDGNEVFSTRGIGVAVGGGWDMRLSGRYRITPFAAYTGTLFASLKHNRTDVTAAGVTLLQVGLGLTRY